MKTMRKQAPVAATKKNPSRPKSNSANESGQIKLLRMRVSAAKSILEETKEQAGQAKRRQKIAKVLAKRARKDVKQAKANLAKAKAAVDRAETAMISGAESRKTKRKSGKDKPVSKPAAASTKRRPAAKRRSRSGSARKPPVPAPTPITETPVIDEVGTTEAAVPTNEFQEYPVVENTDEKKDEV